MVQQIYGIRYSTPCTQCHIQAFKPLSGSSLQATFWQAQYQCRCPQIGQSLIQCQHSKMYRYTITPTGYFSLPDAQFDLVHNDIVGPLHSAKDNMHLFTCVHTFALGHTIAQSQSYKPFAGWIAQLFGVPTTLMSDQVEVEGNCLVKSNVCHHMTNPSTC